MKSLPLRLRLTLWYCAMFAAAAVLLSVSSYWLLGRTLAHTEYYELQERAEDVQLLLKQYGPGASPDTLEKAFSGIYGIKDDGKYLQIADDAGRWVYRSRRMIEWGIASAPAAQLPPDGSETVVHRASRNIRMLAYPITVNGRPYSVQTGLSLRRSALLLSSFAGHLFLLTPAVLIVAAIGGHIMSRKALAPVAAIATEARRINDRNLDIRLPMPRTNDEISHLSETLNQMLERVESGVRSIREFTANAAHEMRTPLALIRTEVEVALSFPRAAAEYREACEQVQKESVRMTGLIDRLLTLARVDAGTEAVRFEPLDAGQLAKQMGDAWKTSMRLALLHFKLGVPDEPAMVSADLNSMQRLLTILLDNAVRYTPPGGVVELCVRREEGRVTFAVSDSGIGIAPEHLPLIFERFYRADRTRGTATGGSGLGLSLAKWIAEKHGTDLSVTSKVGHGTCFQLSMQQLCVISAAEL